MPVLNRKIADCFLLQNGCFEEVHWMQLRVLLWQGMSGNHGAFQDHDSFPNRPLADVSIDFLYSQKSSWKFTHKHECPLLKRAVEREECAGVISVETVRLVIQAIVRLKVSFGCHCCCCSATALN